MRASIFLSSASLLFITGLLSAAQGQVEPISSPAVPQRNLSQHPLVTDSGLEWTLSLVQIYQQNVHGGLSTHRRAGRVSGSYDLDLTGDLEKLFGFEALGFYALAEGGYSEGISSRSAGSFFGVNDTARGDRSMDISELWLQWVLADETVHFRVGKLDLTAGFECRNCPSAFDGSSYANNENAQFLNSALVNNPAIPFPAYGLGAAFFYNPADHDYWYISTAVVDAQADERETGVRTTFHDEDYLFFILETGIAPQLNSPRGPMQGAYRFGLWYDPQDKERFSSGTIRRDDTGIYLSCDQLVYKEQGDPEDTQGLGVFVRYGWASSKVNELTNFFSVGFQYQGLIEARDHDVMAIGFAHGSFSDAASAVLPQDYESVMEFYYSAQVRPGMDIAPSVQYITNPAGEGKISDALVFGLRMLLSF